VCKGTALHELGNDVDAVECINDAILKNQLPSLTLPEWYKEIIHKDPLTANNSNYENDQYKKEQKDPAIILSHMGSKPASALRKNRIVLYIVENQTFITY
jgi:hypothetical protein